MTAEEALRFPTCCSSGSSILRSRYSAQCAEYLRTKARVQRTNCQFVTRCVTNGLGNPTGSFARRKTGCNAMVHERSGQPELVGSCPPETDQTPRVQKTGLTCLALTLESPVADSATLWLRLRLLSFEVESRGYLSRPRNSYLKAHPFAIGDALVELLVETQDPLVGAVACKIPFFILELL